MAPGYESVRRMLEDNFKSGSEENSQLCVYVDGEVVVDLWGSTAMAPSQNAFTADTVTNVFSSTKSLTAICIAMLVDRGGTNVLQWWWVVSGLSNAAFQFAVTCLSHRVFLDKSLFNIKSFKHPNLQPNPSKIFASLS